MKFAGKFLFLLLIGILTYSCAGLKGAKQPGFQVMVQFSDGSHVDSAMVDSIGISTFPQLQVEREQGPGARFSLRGLETDQRYRIDVQFGLKGILLTRDQFYMDDERITLKIPSERRKIMTVVGTRPNNGGSGGTAVPTKQ